MKTISPYNPKSWFTEIGRAKILRKLMPKLPDVNGKLFLTLTTDPKNYSSPSTAFDHARDLIRRMMCELRKGVQHKDKTVKIDAPYMVKVEFHKNGWAHFHLIVLTRRYLDGGLLNEIWGLGRTNVQRIRNRDFHYLLKYVTKGCDLPEWVKERTRMRIIQTSRDFYKTQESESTEPEAKCDIEVVSKNESTIGERLERWSVSAMVTCTTDSGSVYRYLVQLVKPYWEIIQEHVYELALAREYFGRGQAMFYDHSLLSKYLL